VCVCVYSTERYVLLFFKNSDNVKRWYSGVRISFLVFCTKWASSLL